MRVGPNWHFHNSLFEVEKDFLYTAFIVKTNGGISVKSKSIFFALLVILVLSPLAFAAPPPVLDVALDNLTEQIVVKLPAPRQTIAVTDFTDLSGNSASLGKYLADEVTAKLSENGGCQVVDRQRVEKIAKANHIDISTAIDRETVKNLGKSLDATLICTGFIIDFGNDLELNVKLLSAQSGSMIAAFSVKIPIDAKTLAQLIIDSAPPAALVRDLTGVAVDGGIAVDFSKELYKGPGFDRIALLASGGAAVPSAIKINGRKIELTPEIALDYDATYQIVFPKDALKNDFGNFLADEVRVTLTTEKYIHVTGIRLDQSKLSLRQNGNSGQLTARVLPDDASNKEIQWGSSNSSVAVVDDGEVIPVAVGQAFITAETMDGHRTAVCKVIVRQPVVTQTDAGNTPFDGGNVIPGTGLSTPINKPDPGKAEYWASLRREWEGRLQNAQEHLESLQKQQASQFSLVVSMGILEEVKHIAYLKDMIRQYQEKENAARYGY